MCQLYLNEQGTKVRCSGRRLIIEKEDKELFEAPIHKIERVIAMGKIQFTSSALALLLDRGVEVVLTTSKGRLRGVLLPPDTPSVELRQSQYSLIQDQHFCLQLARHLVLNKINNVSATLKRYSANRVFQGYQQAQEAIRTTITAVEKSSNIDQLRGYEGIVTKDYFYCLIDIFKNLDMNFNGRFRRPPIDPVNSALSFTYVLLTEMVTSYLQMNGLDVFCGFMHKPNRNAPALALDLVEQYRQPVADRFVMYLFHNRIIKQKDFCKTQKYPFALQEDARKRLIRTWEEFLDKPQFMENNIEKISPRQLLQKHSQLFRSAVIKKEAFGFFKFWAG